MQKRSTRIKSGDIVILVVKTRKHNIGDIGTWKRSIGKFGTSRIAVIYFSDDIYELISEKNLIKIGRERKKI